MGITSTRPGIKTRLQGWEIVPADTHEARKAAEAAARGVGVKTGDSPAPWRSDNNCTLPDPDAFTDQIMRNNEDYRLSPSSVCGLAPASGQTGSPSGWRTDSCSRANRYQASRIGNWRDYSQPNRTSQMNTRYQRGIWTGRCGSNCAARFTRHKATPGPTAGSRCCRSPISQRCGGYWKVWMHRNRCRNRTDTLRNVHVHKEVD